MTRFLVMLAAVALAGSAPASHAQSAAFGLAEEKPGIEFRSAGDGLYVNAWLRAQTRFSDPFDADPRSVADLQETRGSHLQIRRARIKAKGYLLLPSVAFAYEQSLRGNLPLLDLRLDLRPRDDIKLRVGQYKVLYNRERVDSSGEQQFVERSIANRVFTLDRQRGLTVSKRFLETTRLDSWLDIGVFDGDGRDPGELESDPLYVARWQWLLFGRELPYGQSDLGFRDKPAATLAFAAARVRGPYTRYSTAGGGQLDGFETGAADRYDIRQWVQEFAWQFAGMSLQQEYHEKRIEDRATGNRSLFRGGYLQFGRAWPVEFAGTDRALELAVRVARVESDGAPLDRVRDELTVAANLFLDGHLNKVTLDTSRIGVDEAGGGSDHDFRVRLQWDVSF